MNMELRSSKRRRSNNAKEEEVMNRKPDLPSEIMVEIFSKLDLVDILCHAQFVSPYWMKIAKNPRIFHTLRLPSSNSAAAEENPQLTDEVRVKLLEVAVERSEGQVTKISMASCNAKLAKGLVNVCADLPLLEELEFTDTELNRADTRSKFLCCTVVTPIGKSCKQLKYLRVFSKVPLKMGQRRYYVDDLVTAIATNMPNLRGLRLYLTSLTNITLKAILDSCPHLEELDLEDCCFSSDMNIQLKEDLVKECRRRIKDFTLPSGLVRYGGRTKPTARHSFC